MFTILDVQNNIVSFLCSKNHFAFDCESDWKALEENEEARNSAVFREAVKICFEKLVSIEIVTKIQCSAGLVWILNKPLSDHTQTVSINGLTAGVVAEILNSEYKKAKVDRKVNALSLSSHHIEELALVVLNYQQAQKATNPDFFKSN